MRSTSRSKCSRMRGSVRAPYGDSSSTSTARLNSCLAASKCPCSSSFWPALKWRSDSAIRVRTGSSTAGAPSKPPGRGVTLPGPDARQRPWAPHSRVQDVSSAMNVRDCRCDSTHSGRSAMSAACHAGRIVSRPHCGGSVFLITRGQRAYAREPARTYGRASLALLSRWVNNKSNRLSSSRTFTRATGATVKTRCCSPRSRADGVTIARSETTSFLPGLNRRPDVLFADEVERRLSGGGAFGPGARRLAVAAVAPRSEEVVDLPGERVAADPARCRASVTARSCRGRARSAP